MVRRCRSGRPGRRLIEGRPFGLLGLMAAVAVGACWDVARVLVFAFVAAGDHVIDAVAVAVDAEHAFDEVDVAVVPPAIGEVLRLAAVPVSMEVWQ